MKKRMYLGMQANARSLNYLLGWLIAGTRGGPNRARIIEALRQSSLNTNQIAAVLRISYKTAKTQLETLEKNRIVTCSYEEVKQCTLYLKLCERTIRCLRNC